MPIAHGGGTDVVRDWGWCMGVRKGIPGGLEGLGIQGIVQAGERSEWVTSIDIVTTISSQAPFQ